MSYSYIYIYIKKVERANELVLQTSWESQTVLSDRLKHKLFLILSWNLLTNRNSSCIYPTSCSPVQTKIPLSSSACSWTPGVHLCHHSPLISIINVLAFDLFLLHLSQLSHISSESQPARLMHVVELCKC